jgi:hypothetical protein
MEIKYANNEDSYIQYFHAGTTLLMKGRWKPVTRNEAVLSMTLVPEQRVEWTHSTIRASLQIYNAPNNSSVIGVNRSNEPVRAHLTPAEEETVRAMAHEMSASSGEDRNAQVANWLPRASGERLIQALEQIRLTGCSMLVEMASPVEQGTESWGLEWVMGI